MSGATHCRATSRPALFAAALAALLAVGCADPHAPLVLDGAALMTREQRDFIETYHAYLRRDHDIDYRVVTVSGAGDMDRFALDQYASLGVGDASSSARGLLLVVDAAADRVRLEVGYALEGVYPDAFVAYVEQRQMVPFFTERRVADGILAATELIVTRAQRAAARAGFESEVWMAGSGGAGASTSARLGRGFEPPRPRAEGRYEPGETPQATLRSYLAATAAREADPELALYTPETRRMLEGRIVTAAQMDGITSAYRDCTPQPAKLSADGRRAVIRYPVAQRQCAPWFFERISARWHLDLATMQRVIRFGRSNAWRFERRASHPYAFAFADWTLDEHGFPKE